MSSTSGLKKTNNYTVYKHTSPSGKVYIGITSRNPLYRWNHGNGYRRNEHFFRAIVKYGCDNIKHEILFYGLTKEEACKKEIDLIYTHKSADEKFGYNNDHGGIAAGKISDQTKRKMSEAHKGKERSEEYRRHISEAKKGSKNPCYGKYGALNHNSKMVVQKDLQGNVLHVFNAISEAERECGLPCGAFKNISACASGKKKTAYGFVWCYYE